MQRSMRLMSYLLGLLILTQLVAPAVAQIDVPPLEEPLTLEHQPPASADSLDQFFPPKAEVVVLGAESETTNLTTNSKTEGQADLQTEGDEPPTEPLFEQILAYGEVTAPTNEDTAVNVQDSLVLYVEHETFATDQEVQLANVQLADPVQIGVYFGLTPTVAVTPTGLMATSETTPTLPGRSNQLLAQFELEAPNPEQPGQEAEFQKPVRVVLDLRQYGLDVDEIGGTFYIAYEDENNPGQWIDIPVTIYQSEGLISGETDHFSNWVAGWRPEAWKLQWSPPTVAEFAGAEGYSYPLDIPPGRGGLQPNVGLSYSGAALRGAVQTVSNGNIAAGWSMNDIAITRTKIDTSSGQPFYGDEFRLTINGTGYKLIQGTTNGDNSINFFVENGPSIKVLNYGGLRWNNNTTLCTYWIVQTGDGLHYRLGYSNNNCLAGLNNPSVSYQSVQMNSDAVRSEPLAWHVDTITDQFGNQIVYSYNRYEQFEQTSFWCPGVCTLKTWTYNSVPAKIEYNFTGRVTSYPVPHNVTRLSGTHASEIRFNYTGIYLSNIETYHGTRGGVTPALNKKYVLNASSDTYTDSNNLCKKRNVDGSFSNRLTTTRVINTITEQVVNVETGGWLSLPTTTFTYVLLPQLHTGGVGCFWFKHMLSVTNGYGAETRFNYAADSRVVGTYDNCWTHNSNCPNQEQLPSVAYNYFVTNIAHTDGYDELGDGKDWVHTSYAYEGRCYDQVQAIEAICPQPETTSNYGNIGGHAKITTTVSEYSNSSVTAGARALTRTIGEYYTYGDYFGRPWVQHSGEPSGSTIANNNRQETQTYYGVENIPTGIPGLTYKFIYTSEVRSFTYSNSTNVVSSKVVYVYGSGNQINQAGTGVQLGQQTEVREYDAHDAVTPIRTSRSWYLANLANGYWIIRPYSQAVYSGSSWTMLNGSWSYYDSQAHGVVPTKGLATRTRQLLVSTTDDPFSCANVPGGGGTNCTVAYRTVEQTASFDLYGNTTNTTTYSDYGIQTQKLTNPVNAYLQDNPPTQARTTTITYDSTYNLYPIQVQSPIVGYSGSTPIRHTTNFLVYGFNAPLSGFQTQAGLLYQVQEPSGLSTFYEYDPFGRLYSAYDHNDSKDLADYDKSDGNPIMRYEYFDNSWQGAMTAGEPFRISTRTRPAVYATGITGYELHQVAYYDGFGRAVQTQERTVDTGSGNNQRTITTTGYDELGQAVCVTVPFAVAQATTFYNVDCTANPHNKTVYGYTSGSDDVTGLSDVRQIAPDNSSSTIWKTTTSSVTVNGNSKLFQEFALDANSRLVSRYTNSLGQLVMVREHSGTGTASNPIYAQTIYSYDLLGGLTQVQRYNGTGTGLNATITMSYDGFGRKVKLDDPDMGTWFYKYNAAGQLSWQKDGENQQLCMVYDRLDRLVVKSKMPSNNNCPAYNDNPSLRLQPSDPNWLADYLYSLSGVSIGQLTQVQWRQRTDLNSGVDWETFSYNTNGLLSSQTRSLNGRSYTLSYPTYDSLNRPTMISYPSGESAITNYDREGANSLNVASLNLVSNMVYNGRGQLTFIDRLGANDTSYSYYNATGTAGNSNYRLQTIQHGGANTDALPDYQYNYDVVGNITSLLEKTSSQTQTSSYGYDYLYRLTSASANSATGLAEAYTHSYEYNELGNLTKLTDSGVVQEFDYSGTADQPHALQTVKVNNNTLSIGIFTYDDTGNMTGRELNGDVYTQTFDHENRLSRVTKSGVTTSFRYDASGQRTTTVEGSVVTYYPFPMYEEEVNGSTVTKRSTYLLGSQAVAVRTQVNSGAATFYYLMGDHLGNASTIVQTNGTVAYQGRFLPFGGERAFPGYSNANNPTELGFTGHHQNSELGLVYMNARFYVPGIGRFASADTVVPNPANPQSYNRYTYVHNNPMIFNDPTGHWVETAWDIGSLVVGVGSLGYNLYEGNYGDAAVDALGVVIDAATVIIPAVPGGASMIIKAGRTANAVDNAIDAGSAAVKYGDEAVQLADEAVEVASEVGEEILQQVDEVKNWSSTDPLVGELANEIDTLYPGHVQQVNIKIEGPNGPLTEVDIVTENAIIQVKSGTGSGAVTQYAKTAENVNRPVIVYGPDLRGSIIKGVEALGGLATRSKELLLEILKP